MNVAFVMILVVVCSNLAALTYARTAARVGEITVRTALGATRGRILAQLFTEALALVALAACSPRWWAIRRERRGRPCSSASRRS
jgi:ABC-type antimicrobial peptide transport system permease subunit